MAAFVSAFITMGLTFCFYCGLTVRGQGLQVVAPNHPHEGSLKP